MKINVVSRDFFAERMGTVEELELLQNYRIISLNTSRGSAAMPPFSNLRSKNLLCLTVDDIVGKVRGMTLFNHEHAEQIWRFVENCTLPLMVHCRAGISRSGAVGEVLNWYFNSYLQQQADSFAAFYREHPHIEPNPHVRTVLLENLDQRLNLSKGSSWKSLKQDVEKLKASPEGGK